MRHALGSVLVAAIGLLGASPGMAQTRVTSLEDLRRELTTGDLVTVVPADGQPVAGRLMRLSTVDLDVRVTSGRTAEKGGTRDVTIPFEAIQSLERPRDPARNGALVGAGIGAGFGGTMFVYAMAIDRNEIDEWAAPYAGVAAVCTGIGALIGWAIDRAHSKPHLRFDSSSAGRTTVSVQPMYARGRGIALAVSVSR